MWGEVENVDLVTQAVQAFAHLVVVIVKRPAFDWFGWWVRSVSCQIEEGSSYRVPRPANPLTDPLRDRLIKTLIVNLASLPHLPSPFTTRSQSSSKDFNHVAQHP